jgi:hypothetical protein
MKGIILSYGLLLGLLPAAHMNCSKGESPEQKPQTNNTITTVDNNGATTGVTTGTTIAKQDTVIFKSQKGTIHIYVCTRGCYQYVLETELNGKIYKLAPDVLGESFKKNDLKVVFSGKLTGELVDINKPSPNDVPVFDFKAPKILMVDIKLEN